MSQDIDKPLLRSLVGLASVVEARDPYTGGHSWRVGQFSKALAETIGLDRDQVFLAGIGGVLHDLGKVGVPDAILRKPDKLTDQEYGIIKTHPSVGRELLEAHPLSALAMDAVFTHHETPDGRGYPHGLAGGDIPLIGRIVGLVDAFDAMTSTRPYRKGMPIEKALSIIEAEKGRQFDAALAESFAALHAKGGTVAHIVGHSDHGQRLVSCPMCGPIVAVAKSTQAGEKVQCRNCCGEFILHDSGDTFELELLGPTEDALKLRPRPETEALEEFVGLAPPPRSLHWFGLPKLFGREAG